MRSRRGYEGNEPRTRVGICCGRACREKPTHPDVALYRVRPGCYRCARCYKRETGYKPTP